VAVSTPRLEGKEEEEYIFYGGKRRQWIKVKINRANILQRTTLVYTCRANSELYKVVSCCTYNCRITWAQTNRKRLWENNSDRIIFKAQKRTTSGEALS